MDPIDRDAAIKELRALADSAEIIPFTKAKEYAILILHDAQKRLLKLPSVQPNLQPTCNRLATDCISRQAVIDALEKVADLYYYNEAWNYAIGRAEMEIEKLSSVQPDDRLAKIADLVEGTIDHFDLDDAMDLLYQIKEVLK